MVSSCSSRDTSEPDEYNSRAYALRYSDCDLSKQYARRAFDLSTGYVDGQAQALNHLAFVAYHEMRFSDALHLLDSVYLLTNNQVELLCADVMRMKISQRTGDLRIFYRAWHNAENRTKRISQETEHLTPASINRLAYATSEMHIIASTYYYYNSQDSLSRAEIYYVDPQVTAVRDTSEWISYLYMLGTGGFISGDSVTVAVEEFDNLMHAYTVARKTNNLYFQANCLQAIALALEKPEQQVLIREQRSGALNYIGSIVEGYDDDGMLRGKFAFDDNTPLDLMRISRDIFRFYGDIFQEVNVLRTQSELLFNKGRYDECVALLDTALTLIDIQHERDSLRVPYWEARIYEQLSMNYSALNDTCQALGYRKMYLERLDNMRQDLEEGARADELAQYNKILYLRLSLVGFVAILMILSFWLLVRYVNRKGRMQVDEMLEKLEVLKERTKEAAGRLEYEKLSHIERRAKVSLAESVVPYINRMLHSNDSDYVIELADKITELNDLLTHWIQVRQGRLSMNISTFALQPILDTLAKNKLTYQRKGVDFQVPYTDVQLKGDNVLTLFMLNTLCDNALKYTPEGGRIAIEVGTTDSYVELSVVDSGCGLSGNDVEVINNSKVWDAKSIGSKEHKGFGFGLMNCKGIIGHMKKMSSRFQCCDFGVESEIGKGSRFWFRLPRVLMLVLCFAINLSLFAEDLSASDKRILQERREQLNELSISALNQHRWDLYRKYNDEYIKVHRQLTADPDLPVYAARLHSLESEARWALIFTFLLVTASVFAFTMAVRLSRRKRDMLVSHEENIIMQSEQLNRIQFELDRLHIYNQVLDNCLSTIKHETMYYPARIRQMASAVDTDAEELNQLENYYNDVYTLLLTQAQHQTSLRMSLDRSVYSELISRIKAAVMNVAESAGVDSGDVDIDMSESDNDRIRVLRLRISGVAVPDNMFTPDGGNTDALVAREIIRMHDAACGHPGLRLYVENNEIIITLWKNSKLLS